MENLISQPANVTNKRIGNVSNEAGCAQLWRTRIHQPTSISLHECFTLPNRSFNKVPGSYCTPNDTFWELVLIPPVRCNASAVSIRCTCLQENRNTHAGTSMRYVLYALWAHLDTCTSFRYSSHVDHLRGDDIANLKAQSETFRSV